MTEEFWLLLRSWLRPHRGFSQDKLPLCLGFFQVVHDAPLRANDDETSSPRKFSLEGAEG